MRFDTFSQYLNKLEKTTKRLEMTDILTSLICELGTEEIAPALYLASGYLKAPFESEKFAIAEKMMLRVLNAVYNDKDAPETRKAITGEYNTSGDLGNVALKFAPKKETAFLITEVHSKLLEIAQAEGAGSQEAKVQKTADLLRKLDPVSAKYVVRIILSTLRLGFTELTIIVALAQFVGSKNKSKEIEAVYNIYPDIGLIAKKIKQKGLKGLGEISIDTGVPILSQKPQRVSGMEEAMERLKNVWAEYKFDGTRVQLHLDRTKKVEKIDQNGLFDVGPKDLFVIKTFTRNLEETTHQYPEIIEAAKKQINADKIILDGEAIGYNKETGAFLPFQETIQRKRKHNVAETAKEIPLKYFVFDILFLNGEAVLHKSLRERRKILNEIILPGEVIVVDEFMETDEFEKLEEYFQIAKEKGLEGLVVKNPEDPYQAGARSYSWIKLKNADDKLLEDSLDCVLLGYYYGKGVRSKFGIGGLLVGVRDEKNEVFKTITKIGTGLKEEDWDKVKVLADKVSVSSVPKNVLIDKNMVPDVIISPEILLEVGADEISVSPTHTCGYALRFPRLLKFRTDKNVKDTTTVKEVETMFKRQRKK